MKKFWNLIKINIFVVTLILSYVYLLWGNYIKTIEIRALVEVYGASTELYHQQTDTYFEAWELIHSQREYINGLTDVIKEFNNRKE